MYQERLLDDFLWVFDNKCKFKCTLLMKLLFSNDSVREMRDITCCMSLVFSIFGSFHFKKYKLIFKFSFPEISAKVFTNVIKILLTRNLKWMGLMTGKNSPIIDLLFLETLVEKL